jgi:hypothetical protein
MGTDGAFADSIQFYTSRLRTSHGTARELGDHRGFRFALNENTFAFFGRTFLPFLTTYVQNTWEPLSSGLTRLKRFCPSVFTMGHSSRWLLSAQPLRGA